MLHTSQAEPSSLYFAGVAAPLCALASDYNSSNNSCVDPFLELPAAIFLFYLNYFMKHGSVHLFCYVFLGGRIFYSNQNIQKIPL